MAGFDKIDPATACFIGSPGDGVCGRDPRVTAKWVSHFIKKMPLRRLDKGVSVVRESVLHRRTRIVRKLRVLKS